MLLDLILSTIRSLACSSAHLNHHVRTAVWQHMNLLNRWTEPPPNAPPPGPPRSDDPLGGGGGDADNESDNDVWKAAVFGALDGVLTSFAVVAGASGSFAFFCYCCNIYA